MNEILTKCPVCGTAAEQLSDYITQPSTFASKTKMRMLLAMCTMCAKVFHKEREMLLHIGEQLNLSESDALDFAAINLSLENLKRDIDRESFEEEFDSHRSLIYKTALRLTGNQHDCKDLVQGAAERAFKAYHSFESGTNFKAWFMRILTNCFWDYGRKSHRVQYADEKDVDRICSQYEPELSDTVVSELRAQDIRNAILCLPETYRVVCVLYFLGEESYQEIAECSGLAVGTVRSRLHRGRKLLQEILVTKGLNL